MAAASISEKFPPFSPFLSAREQWMPFNYAQHRMSSVHLIGGERKTGKKWDEERVSSPQQGAPES